MKKIYLSLICLVALFFTVSNVQAQCPAGQTEVTIEIVTGGFAGEIGWELVNTTTNTIIACQPSGTYAAGGTFTEGPFCLVDGETYEVVGYDTFGDDWNGGFFNAIITEDGSVNGCASQDGCALLLNGGLDLDVEPDVEIANSCEPTPENQEFIVVLPATACDASTVDLSGCSDPTSFNYNPCTDGSDDASCIFPATNDECATATALTIEPDLNCAAPVTGTTIGASESLPGCTGTADDDVWYSFVATGTAHVIQVQNIDGATDIAIEAFDACGGASLLCQDFPDDSATLGGLVPGNTYFFRIYSWTGTAGTTTTFGVCVGTPPPPPANNDCASAISINVEAEGSCPTAENAIDFFSALPSGLVPSCSFNTNDFDVFFTATVPATGALEITTSSTGFDTPGVAVYDACGGAELYCNTFVSSEVITLVAFAGQDVIIQFYDGDTYDFNACIEEFVPITNDDVLTALPLCGGIPLDASNQGATAGANDATDVPAPNCYGSLENTIWYTFESDASGADITMDFIPTANCAGTLQIHILSDLDNDGVFFTEACDNSTGPPTTLTFTPIPNTLYYLFIDGNGGQVCDFTIQDNGGVASCCGPEYSINTYCVPGDEGNFYADFVLTDLGTDPSGYDVNGTSITATGTYTFGPFPNGASALNITGLTETDCIITENIENDCACDPGSISVTTADASINAGDPVVLDADAGTVIPGGFLGYFVDAQASGCSVAPSDPALVVQIGDIGDDASFPVTLPFSFPFFENSYTNFLISSNGYITFGTDGTDLSEDIIPDSANDPNDYIALFWDDLTVNGVGAVAYFADVIGGQNCLVVTYSGIEHLGGGESVTGQIIICEDGTITITCLNCQADNGTDTATQGIENADGTQGYFDPVLTNGQATSNLTNCVTFTPNNAVPSTCDTIGWVTDLNDIPGTLVSSDFDMPTVNPTMTTTYYAVVECNYFEGPTLTCVDEVTITVGNPSACSITPAQATNIVCSDNNTSNDSADDTYTFDITVNGSNTDASAANTFSDNQGNVGIAYGTTVSYGPFPITGGNVTVNFTDTDDVNCVGSMMATAPAACSVCVEEILYDVTATGCDMTGATIDLQDDLGNTISSLPLGNQGGVGTFGAQPCGDYVIVITNAPTCYTDDSGDVGPRIFSTDGTGQELQTFETVVEGIPTLSEWGLITLALMLMSYGSIVMAGAGRLAGSNNAQLPMGFQLPFNAAILRKAFAFTAILAIIGYTMSIVLFGAIFFSDIIGVAIAGPVFAYLAHLLYLIEKK